MHEVPLDILAQPDDTTCGPTCLQAVYRYFGDDVSLDQVIREVPVLVSGGTLAPHLGTHALKRGYDARIYTYNLIAFDPTWFVRPGVDLSERLRAQAAIKHDPKLHLETDAYLQFLALGGEVAFEDLTSALLRRYLKRGIPILTGLSSTYLYRAPREFGPKDDEDDLRGTSSGHFVVLAGYDPRSRSVVVVDPYRDNPVFDSHRYTVSVARVVCSILLGVLTFDANLLVIRPRRERPAAAKEKDK